MLKDSYSRLYNAKIKRFMRDDHGPVGSSKAELNLRSSNGSLPGLEIQPTKGKISDPTFNSNAPKMEIEGSNTTFKMPTFKIPDLGLNGAINGPEGEVKTDLNVPEISSGAIHVRPSKKLRNPDLNLDNPNMDLPNFELPTVTRSKVDLKMPEAKVKMPDLDVDAPSEKFKMPSFGLSGKRPDLNIDADLKSPDVNINASAKSPKIKVPEINQKIPDADIGSPSAPKWTSVVQI
ncbi:unnamed protein product [Merluccius merluccius]